MPNRENVLDRFGGPVLGLPMASSNRHLGTGVSTSPQNRGSPHVSVWFQQGDGIAGCWSRSDESVTGSWLAQLVDDSSVSPGTHVYSVGNGDSERLGSLRFRLRKNDRRPRCRLLRFLPAVIGTVAQVSWLHPSDCLLHPIASGRQIPKMSESHVARSSDNFMTRR